MGKWDRWKGIMKCYPFEEKRLSKWSPPYIVQPKFDGIRCRAIPLENGEYLLLSSEENPIFSVPHINTALNKLCTAYELDGELYCHGMPFDEITSITSRTKNLHPDHTKISFHLFDIICEKQQMQRTLMLEKFKGISRHIQVSPFFVCETLDGIMSVYERLISQHYEGIIVRHIYANYERKRSTWIMKFKPKKSDCYKILGYTEEMSKDGIPKGSLGALICDSGDGNTFNVGSGYDHQDRIILWRDREGLIGKYVKVEYQHLTSGKKVPRFPVFKTIINEEED